ncbi:hypothetical protein ACTFIW_004752 [Dictyostelium discoideum]
MNLKSQILLTVVCLFSLVCLIDCHKKCDNCNQYSWEKVKQKGSMPPLAWDGSSAYDERNELFYVFGGLNGSYPNDETINSFYVFNVKTSSWTNLMAPSSITPRAETMMFLDKRGDYVYLSGGRGPFRRGINIVYNSTQRYDVRKKVWTELNQTPFQQNLANRSVEAETVSRTGKSYTFSGSTSTLPGFIRVPGALKTDTIVFDSVNGWQQVDVVGASPTPRAHHHLLYNEELNSIFTYGGYTNCSTYTSNECNYLGDLWSLDLSTKVWKQHLFDVTKGPGNRDNAKFIYADQNQLFLIGGSNYQYTNFMDVWRFDLIANEWTQLTILPLVDPETNIQTPIPNTIGSFYFKHIKKCSVEFYFSRGSLSEISGSPLVDNMYKLTIPI